MKRATIPKTASGRIERPDGASIYYETTGEGPALLFAHGVGGNHMSWWRQIPAFARDHRCIVFSHRGFAPSTVPSGLPDPHDFAGDAATLMDHLGVEKTVHIGQSMGGWTGVELALGHPDRLAGLVLANTTGSLAYDGFDDPEIARWVEEAPGRAAEIVTDGVHRATSRSFAENEPEMHHLYGMIDRLNSRLDKGAVRARIRAMRARPPEDAARIACPTLCLTGEDDFAIAPPGVRAVGARIPGARVVSLPATGHSTYVERAEMFNAILREFLDEIGW
ncbi:MAG: alpha/beta fold hydrolase [Salinarimonadaceae bacterium]|nr:MAG: alpha/beta fold hydrolase [Salinarimonadaceae bacterium]